MSGGLGEWQSHTLLLLMDESISWYSKRVQTRFQSPGHSINGSPNRFLTGFACQLRVWNPHAWDDTPI